MVEPIELSSIFKTSAKMYKTDFQLFISLGLVNGLAAVMDSIMVNIFHIRSMGVILLASLLVSSWASIALIYAGSNIYSGFLVSFGKAMGNAKGKFLLYIAVSLTYSLIVFAGLFMLIIPGIYLMTVFFFSYVIAVIEVRSLVDCFRRSTELVRGYFGIVLLFSIILGLIYVFPVMLLQAVPAIGRTLGVLLTVFVFPYYVIAHVIFYKQLVNSKREEELM